MCYGNVVCETGRCPIYPLYRQYNYHVSKGHPGSLIYKNRGVLILNETLIRGSYKQVQYKV